MQSWYFTLHASDDDAAAFETIGQVEARNSDEAFIRGFQMYVSFGMDAAEYSAMKFGGKADEYDKAFFSVSPVDEADQLDESLGQDSATHFGPDQ